MHRINLGISCGDPNGIGLEVALRTFSDERLFEYFTPVVFASMDMIQLHQQANGLSEVPVIAAEMDQIDEEANAIQVVTCWEHEPPVEFGRITAEAGACAKTSLDKAIEAMKAGYIDALVTAPIHKQAMQESGFGFPGHTEYLQQQFEADKNLMLLVGDDDLRVAVASNHLPLRQVPMAISPTILQNKIAMLHQCLERDFGIHGPMIAVLGLNPHAGDGGTLGHEEIEIIRPAVENMKAQGMQVFGPYSADGFFGSGHYRDFDGILAMYHDQGLVPFKALSFGAGVNFTAGLSIVRTSPDHGTAMDLAGQGRADSSSFREAAFLAREIYLQREGYDEAHADPLKLRSKFKTDKAGKKPKSGPRRPSQEEGRD